SFTWTATNKKPWVTVSPTSGPENTTVTLTLHPDTLSVGLHADTVVVTAAGALGSPDTTIVTFVIQQPVLVVSPASVTDSANVGTTATRSAALTITNTGGGTLTWSATESPNASWLSGPPSSGSAPSSMTLTLDPSGLAAGIYNTTVVVTSPEANNSPINVPVQFRIRQPVLNVTPGSVSDTATLGVPPPKTATLTVTNGDGGVLAWRDSAAQRSAWLGLAPASAGGPGSITVSLNPANLAAGTYKDTIIVTSTGATGSPARLPVQFHILRPPGLPPGPGTVNSNG